MDLAHDPTWHTACFVTYVGEEVRVSRGSPLGIVIAVAVAAAGAGAWWGMSQGGGAGEGHAAKGHAKEGHANDGHGGSGHAAGPLLDLDPIVVNLSGNGSELHYLKTSISVEFASESAKHHLEGRIPVVRNDMLVYLSGLKLVETLGPSNKEKIRKALYTQLVEHFGADSVLDVYLQEFLIQ